MRLIGAGLLALSGLWSVSAAEPVTDWAERFRNPPRSAQPWVYYFVMDGNLSREGITADFEALHRAGVGGLIFLEVDVGIPRGPVPFMSPAWRGIFVHAVREAERLGLQITLNAGPGWTGSGGPWVKPDQSMQHLVASAVEVVGPRSFDAILPRPQPRPAYFGENHIPPDLRKAKNDFGVDECVLAIPTTRERLERIDEKALYVRDPYSSKPGTRSWLPEPAPAPTRAVPASQVRDLTGRLGADGRLTWEVPEGSWTILRFARTSTGANTRPAPRAGLGLECDKFDPAALDAHFDAFVGTLLRDVGPRSTDAGWTSLHIDSWEMGAQNWTAGFRDAFRRRRGYDPLPYLPTLTGRLVGSAEISERFLWDLRQTAQELVIEHYARRLRDLGRKHQLGLSIEPYDMNPCADLSLGAVADVPMGEFWLYGYKTFFTVHEAASIGHTQGRPIIAAEAFTSTAEERWQAHPASMKSLGDWAFCNGINRIVFHRTQHQPDPNRRPGMTMGPYGVHWERTQTWWEMVPAYHAYLARCQDQLRRGQPVADVLFLAAEGAPHVFRPPSEAVAGSPPDPVSYRFDAIAPETLRERVTVRDGRLVLPEGTSYRVLVLPDRATMTPALLRHVRDLARAGATVIGPRPERSPSLADFPRADAEIRELAAELWGPAESPPAEQRVGAGRVFSLPRRAPTSSPDPEQYGDFHRVREILAQLGEVPDFVAEGPLRFIHRRDGSDDIYFLANRSDQAVALTAQFRLAGKIPEWWDPVAGTSRALTDYRVASGRTLIPLRFEPTQSAFVIFRAQAQGSPSGQPNFPPPRKRADLTGPWDVAFDPRGGGPRSARFESLVDWTRRPEDGIRHYSGVATYRRTFDAPAGLEPGPVWLDLGTVHALARVRLNGQDLGVVWCPPWRIDLRPALRERDNELAVEVANLWPNRLIGDQRLPPRERLASTTWNPFKPDAPLLPSGWLGPATLWQPGQTGP